MDGIELLCQLDAFSKKRLSQNGIVYLQPFKNSFLDYLKKKMNLEELVR